MRKPVQRNSEAFSRSMRRDMMIGTAALVLIETGLGAAASAMGDKHHEAEQGSDAVAEDAIRSMRPLEAADGAPDTHVGMTLGLRPVPPPPQDDGEGSLLDYGLGSGVGGHARYGGGNADMPSGGYGYAPHLAADLFNNPGMRPPSYEGSFGASPGSGHDAPPGLTGLPLGTPQNLDVKIGTDGDDVILGSDADDYVFGGDGNDRIFGGGGNDRLLGGNGDDTLVGGTGRDMLIGDKGDDELTGGAGADTFYFRSDFGHDTITDFKAGGELDVIEVAKGEFASFAALSANLVDSDLGVVLTLHDGSTLTLSHVTKASLAAGDFHFGV